MAGRPTIVPRRPVVMPAAVPLWLVLPTVALVAAVSPVPPWFVEQVYATRLYPILQAIVTTVTNLLPISVLDVLIAALVTVLGFWLHRAWRLARHRGVFDAVWEVTRRALRLAAAVALTFLLMWGCNYRRMPLESSLAGGQGVTPTPDRLQAAVADASALAARVRPAAIATNASYDALAIALREPMNAALAALGRPPLSVAGRPKFSLILTPYFTAAGINGMVNPVALEAIVHPDLLPFERGYVLAHEWGHLAGLADEAEASAVGWLACMKGPPEAAYSASLYLVMEAIAALPAADRREALGRVDANVRADLRAISERRSRQQPVVREAASRAYNEFLRANRVEDGTASYSRALRLILASPVYDAMGEVRRDRRPPA